MLGDIDDFKAYNDSFGHQKGDDCLRQIAAAMRSALKRPLDMITRYGGEEFAIILPQTNKERSASIADQLIEAVQNLRIPHPQQGQMTLRAALSPNPRHYAPGISISPA
ncbi:MAG: GGDEF domain-containing protein [Bacillota bacterium]